MLNSLRSLKTIKVGRISENQHHLTLKNKKEIDLTILYKLEQSLHGRLLGIK